MGGDMGGDNEGDNEGGDEDICSFNSAKAVGDNVSASNSQFGSMGPEEESESESESRSLIIADISRDSRDFGAFCGQWNK